MYESETTAVTAAMAARRARRAARSPRAATRYARPSAGSTSQASIILAWNARETQTPAITALRHRPVRMAVTVESAASTTSRTMRLSGTFPRSSVMVAGLAASTAAATMPANGPARRRTAWKSTRTVSAPSTAWGSMIDQTWNPNRRTERAWAHRAPGSLSTVMVPAGSKAPKTMSCQLCAMLRTAAA